MRTLPPLVACWLFLVGCGDTADTPTSVSIPDPQLAVMHPGRCELALSEADARTSIEAVRSDVDRLREAQALNRGQRRALHNKLETALEHLGSGRLCPAVAQLEAFMEQVEDFIDDGVLTEAEAAPLLAGVKAVLEGPAPAPLRLEIISAGVGGNTCGVTAGGKAYCWGENFPWGQLGDGTTTRRLVPTAVSGAHAFVSITAGQSHTCALEANGDAYCWGNNMFGRLGDGTEETRFVPTPVSGDHAFVSISAGPRFTCGLQDDSRDAYCWGGFLVVPTPVSGAHAFTSISVGSFHICGLGSDGTAYCWGRNAVGQLGDGTTTDRSVPTRVDGGHTFVAIDAGHSYTCALEAGGDAYCWGGNGAGQLGDGTTTGRLVPTPVSGGHSFVSITAGTDFTCALDVNGEAYCWGDNRPGIDDLRLLGVTSDEDVVEIPMPVVGGHTFVSISAGGNAGNVGGQHTCAIETDGIAYCWGDNTFGALGDGTQDDRNAPTAVANPGGP